MKADKILKFFYEKRNAFVLLLLLAIVALAFWLRIHNVGVKDLWVDEYFTEDGAFYTLKGLWLKGHTRTTLLFSFMMKCYTSVLVFFHPKSYLTPFELRLPNVIYGTLLVALVYFAVKRISDKFTSLYASLLCATSAYMVYYSQDGRYYPFMLIWVIICLWASIGILSNPAFCKAQVKYHLIYLVSGLCGMLTHYGFWIYFAASNIALCLILLYRFFAETAEDNFLKKTVKSSLMVLAMAIPAFAVPLIIFKRNKGGVATVFSEHSDSFLLNKLSYKAINVFNEDFLCDFNGIILYATAIIAIMALLLLIFSKQKRVILYLIMVRFGSFVLLRFTPRNVVNERLRPRYIIFMLLLDIIIFALFSGELVKHLSKAFSFIKKKLVAPIYLFLTLLILFSTAYYTLNILPTSKMRIYVTFNRPSQALERIKELYRDGDVVLTDYMDLFYAMPYFKKLDANIEDIKCYFIDWMTNPSDDYKRIILITMKKPNKVPGIVSLERTNTLYFNILTLPDNLDKEDIGFLLSQTVVSKHGACNDVLEKWSRRKTNVLDYLSSTNQPNNLLSNSNFENGFEGWKVGEVGDAKFSLTNFNKFTSVKISDKGGWSTLTQSFEVEKGKTYKFIVEAKSEDWQEDIKFACRFTDPNKKDTYFNINRLTRTNDWSRFTKVITVDKSGKASVGLQYSNKKWIGEIYIKEVKFVELRDKAAQYDKSAQKDINPRKPENSMIYNGDFKSGFSNWKGGFDLDYEHFRMIYSNGEVYLKLLNQPKENRWFNLHQHFPARKGDVYELSFDYRYYGKANKDSSAFLVFSQLSNGKHVSEKYIQINNKATGNTWKQQKQKLNVSDSKEACLRIQFMGDADCELKNIQLIKLESGK